MEGATMKTLAVMVVAAIAATLMMAINTSAAEQTIPAWYYSSPCQQPPDTTLHEWLRDLPWYGELDMGGGGWDCSQMSARIEWMVENCGYSAVVQCKDGEGKLGHCWVVVEGAVYEATGNYWADGSLPIYEADRTHPGIGSMFEANGSAAEWGWWLTYPTLIEGEQQ
jgi:hypothetical protein